MYAFNLTQWFWPLLCLVLASLWLYTLWRQRRASTAGRPLTSSPIHWPVDAEDVLKAAYILQERGSTWEADDLAGAAGRGGVVPEAVAGALVASGWAKQDTRGEMHLTQAGEARAQELIRAHRLWERYLVDQESMRLDQVHAEAHRREHEMTAEEVERLDAQLGHPAWDPHGHPIPAPGGQVPVTEGTTLFEEATPGRRLRIISLDDEPAPLLAQLVAMGLKPGADLEVLERETDVLHLRLDGEVAPLALAAAQHVLVVPLSALPVPLGELPVGARALVVEIGGHGKHQRRMLDMGFVPGASVTVIRRAPLGDPIEYLIKDTSVALRHEDANTVMVGELSDG